MNMALWSRSVFRGNTPCSKIADIIRASQSGSQNIRVRLRHNPAMSIFAVKWFKIEVLNWELVVLMIN